MPEEIKRTPTINVVIQEFSVLERLDKIAEIFIPKTLILVYNKSQ